MMHRCLIYIQTLDCSPRGHSHIKSRSCTDPGGSCRGIASSALDYLHVEVRKGIHVRKGAALYHDRSENKSLGRPTERKEGRIRDSKERIGVDDADAVTISLIATVEEKKRWAGTRHAKDEGLVFSNQFPPEREIRRALGVTSQE
jgi:hypothetical protein